MIIEYTSGPGSEATFGFALVYIGWFPNGGGQGIIFGDGDGGMTLFG